MPDAPRRNPIPSLITLALGIGLWLFLQSLGSSRRSHATWDPQSWAVLAACIAVACVPQIRRPLISLAKRLPDHRRLTTLLAALAAALLMLITARLEHRDFFPRNHDEHMYLIQAQMLAHGRLWMPQHPLADFFETFHVLVKPKYASIYFPGASLLYVPSIWLHLPTWIESLLICGLIVGLVYRVTAELLDDTSGLLAAAIILSLPRFRQFSLMIMSHTVVLLMGLLMTYAYLKWRRATRTSVAVGPQAHPVSPVKWALFLGLFTAWAAITRPVDALCFAIPLAAAFLLDLIQLPSRQRLTTLLIATAAALPLLSLQLIEDYGITGHLLQTPATLYANHYWPELNMGFHAYQPDRVPPTELPQMRQYYADFIQPRVKEHQPGNVMHTFLNERFPTTLVTDLPNKLLAILLPVGLLGLTDRRRVAVAAVYPLFLLGYTPFLFFLRHYTIPAVPALALVVLLGRHVLQGSLPRVADSIGVSTALAMLAFSAIALTLPGETPSKKFNTLRDVNNKLAGIPGKAVVLFRYAPSDDLYQEPVYNIATPWPDNARIVRAHDLGPTRNAEIFAYYPDRAFYLYDRASHTLTNLPVARATSP